jgi:hypothetical protein
MLYEYSLLHRCGIQLSPRGYFLHPKRHPTLNQFTTSTNPTMCFQQALRITIGSVCMSINCSISSRYTQRRGQLELVGDPPVAEDSGPPHDAMHMLTKSILFLVAAWMGMRICAFPLPKSIIEKPRSSQSAIEWKSDVNRKEMKRPKPLYDVQ